MRISSIKTLPSPAAPSLTLWRAPAALLHHGPLAAIMALAAALRLVDLPALGYSNHYYTAAVAAMLQSWHNFFFVAAEPGGLVSVDKPPLGLWIEAAFAAALGVNGAATVLPQILAGLLSVLLLYHLVARRFGSLAGLVAALALAITPVFVAVNRNNTMDSTLILALLLAAWAWIKAAESGKLWHLLAGAALVGAAFNVKMLEAFLPLPAFVALYLIGGVEPLRRRLPKLGLAGAVVLLVSFSWVAAVDLTPAAARPYVGSSGDNSELSLVFGYNGLARLLGMGPAASTGLAAVPGRVISSLLGGSGPGSGAPAGGFGGTWQRGPGAGQSASGGSAGRGGAGFGGFGPGGQPSFGAGPFGGRGAGGPGVPSQAANADTGPLQALANGVNSLFANPRVGAGGIGASNVGRPGLLRLISTPLSNQASWLLPFALISALLLLLTPPRRPLHPRHQALLLWGGWLLLGALFFSAGSFFHEYYLSLAAPPIAALTGIGAGELWRLRSGRPGVGAALLLLAAGLTLWFELRTASAFTADLPWLSWTAALFAAGAAAPLLPVGPATRRIATGFAAVVAAMLVPAGVWSGLTALNPSANQSLPAAYAGQPSSVLYGGALRVDQGLLAYLAPRTQDTTYLMAVPSSMQGSDYVIATSRPVLYLGGFLGRDQVVTPEQLDQLVASGQLRYIYWNAPGRLARGGFGGGNGQPQTTAWITANCRAVPGFETTVMNSGAPGGTSRRDPGPGGSRGGFQISLYECGAAV